MNDNPFLKVNDSLEIENINTSGGTMNIHGGGMVVTTQLYDFTSHTFTPCGKTGRYGPTSAECLSAYSSTSWASNGSFFSVPVDGYQLWTVPVTTVPKPTLEKTLSTYKRKLFTFILNE